ncbi:melanotransferrin-like [Lingula anatina]|uniref:Melanotransferrin-like n=1 Tax=Lingula anatina TaxID=7574 RepID=A0A1S3HL00_LINAN|nr:melanotransferrin-like [Lingula anatina]|eukprot:XP_013386136.1 melanotransferrin-like [Lingula anatina]
MKGWVGSFLVLIYSSFVVSQTEVAKWCAISEAELQKCNAWSTAVQAKQYTGTPRLECVLGENSFDCMDKISRYTADLMAVDAGDAYFAGRFFSLAPIMAEEYINKEQMYAVAVVKKGTNFNIKTLAGKNSCHPGINSAAGYVYPMAQMFQSKLISVTECNVQLKSVANFFNVSCIPGALSTHKNVFGDNPPDVCSLCQGRGSDFCMSSDPFGGFAGAFQCLASGRGDVAFLRHADVLKYTRENPNYADSDFELLCPTVLESGVEVDPVLFRRPVSDFRLCNFGQVPDNVVMTGSRRTTEAKAAFKSLLSKSSRDFTVYIPPSTGIGTNATTTTTTPRPGSFRIFESRDFGAYDLLFSDDTRALADVGQLDTYYEWLGDKFRETRQKLIVCPLPYTRWCVISSDEMAKCEQMKMNFAAMNLRPTLDCVRGDNARDCMRIIKEGDADIINLDASDVYIAGRNYGLVPIAYENLGDANTDFYYAVAVSRKVDSTTNLFNLKDKRTCHSGIGLAAGWIVPMDIMLQTGQLTVDNCDLYEALGRFVSRSCVPGILDPLYNVKGTNPISLCEACASGGRYKCQRNSVELYYSDTGAFRCLAEGGGDVAFVMHTTVRDNTGGKNQAEWARNRRADDYELLCKDGTRASVDDWKTCYLSKVPASAIVTADYKDEETRNHYWNLLNYGQYLFGSDR